MRNNKMRNKTEKFLAKYRKLSPQEAFEFNQMVTISYHSCKIEGSTLTKEETFLLLLESLPENENESESN